MMALDRSPALEYAPTPQPSYDPSYHYVVPADTLPAGPSLPRFLAMNPDLSAIKKKRDKFIGWMRYVLAAIFTFLLLSPILAFIPTVSSKGWLLALVWVVFALLMLYYIEYWHRAEIWYLCLCRGLIVEYKHTHELKQWLFHPVILTALLFMTVFGVVIGVSKDGELWDQIVTGFLAAISLLFIFKVCQNIIALESANHLLTLNLLVVFMEDPHLLETQGFKVIHQTQLMKWFLEDRKAKGGGGTFQWAELFALNHECVPEPKLTRWKRYIWGILISTFLKKYKDLDI